MAQGNMINLECNEDETEEPNQDANLTDMSQKEVYKTHKFLLVARSTRNHVKE